jgi:hypothetical protein
MQNIASGSEDSDGSFDPMDSLNSMQRKFVQREFPFILEHIQALQQDPSEEAIEELDGISDEIHEHVEEMMDLHRNEPGKYAIERKIIEMEF